MYKKTSAQTDKVSRELVQVNGTAIRWPSGAWRKAFLSLYIVSHSQGARWAQDTQSDFCPGSSSRPQRFVRCSTQPKGRSCALEMWLWHAEKDWKTRDCLAQKGHFLGMHTTRIRGGEHTIRCTDEGCNGSPETCIVLSASVTPIHSIKGKK